MADYFDLPPLISLILLLIPFTAWILGILTRLKEGHILAAIIRIFFGWICWVCELILTILGGCQVRLLRVINC